MEGSVQIGGIELERASMISGFIAEKEAAAPARPLCDGGEAE
jgi:hypothetical protein